MEADYTYYTNGLVQRIEYSNNTSVNYVYDAALRLTSIDHRDILENTILKLSYEYTADGLIARITETDNSGVVGWVKFAYDARGRLIKEVRTGEHPYHIAYEYDPGSNRTRKVQSLPGCDRIETVYYYDVEDPETYGSFNNRLMYYETFETCRVFEDYGHEGSCGTGGDAPVSTTWYYYGQSGNPWYIVTEEHKDTPEYSGTRLHYASNGRAVVFALGISWIKNDPAYNIDWAREFRYDGARQRYMNTMLDPEDLESEIIDPISTTWSDYDGDSVYGDFEMIAGAATDIRSFEPGIGKFDWSGVDPDANSVQFYHANQIGTTRFMTDPGGTRIESSLSLYTAFGERVDGTNHRYGYAGAHGYQTHDDLPFLHVGARYYDPATGRFLQRDPIGITGGTNVYAYMFNIPTVGDDPNGKFFGIIIGGIIGGIVGGVVGGVNGGLIGAIAGVVGGTVSGAITGTGVGAGVAGAVGGAVGGAVAGALGGYGSGKGAGGIAASAGIGALAGGLTGGVGGSAVGGSGAGAGTSGAVGAAGSMAGAGITLYFDDLPSAILCAGERLGASRR